MSHSAPLACPSPPPFPHSSATSSSLFRPSTTAADYPAAVGPLFPHLDHPAITLTTNNRNSFVREASSEAESFAENDSLLLDDPDSKTFHLSYLFQLLAVDQLLNFEDCDASSGTVTGPLLGRDIKEVFYLY